MVNQTPHCRFDLLRVDTNVQKRSSTCIKRTAGNGRMDDGLNCGRNVPGITRQTNALSFYSLGNEVDKERSRTASLIYKSIVIGITKIHDENLQLLAGILVSGAAAKLPGGDVRAGTESVFYAIKYNRHEDRRYYGGEVIYHNGKYY